MDADTRNAFHAEAKAESLETLGRLADLKVEYRSAEVERPSEPEPDPVGSETDREIASLLAYRGDNPGLRWRADNARRERARQQAIVERQEREVSRQQPKTNANTGVKEMITDECFKVARGVGQVVERVVENLEKQLDEVRVDVRIAGKRADLAELHAEIAKARPAEEEVTRAASVIDLPALPLRSRHA
ncbi:hypothetical protein G6321_00048595 [Bradyrhizobium barranii subsp. barranii]|uniref:Uncharacterized protein n=1 Tax=Bradyrhizobium barranii subsp. barranii TaxID=2823807 RepID=A0A7Z0QD20_9BRAD|nr:hypothetical protein [Bradyrhizobium barranii]UGX93380.1 hypothetical protein G6321_00048595 [Bradyrhizobium barranii subsp. barranii]